MHLGHDDHIIDLPEFGTRQDLYPFRVNKGSPDRGLLSRTKALTTPSAEVREANVGFLVRDTLATGLDQEQRIHLLGQCLDLDVFSWLVHTTTTAISATYNISTRVLI